MSTEFYIIAEKDDDLIVFDHLYKCKRTMLAFYFGENEYFTIDQIIKDYHNSRLEYSNIENLDEIYKHDIELLLKLLSFLSKYNGYTIKLLTDWELIDYLYEKYDDWEWNKLNYFEK